MVLSLIPKFHKVRLRPNPWCIKAPYTKRLASITDFVRQSLLEGNLMTEFLDRTQPRRATAAGPKE